MSKPHEEAPNTCDCGHSVWWHDGTHGCGYLGYNADRRCSCPLAQHESLRVVVMQAKRSALLDAASRIVREAGLLAPPNGRHPTVDWLYNESDRLLLDGPA